MKEINFVTIGDSNFFPYIIISAESIFHFYPHARLFIYDWGFKKRQKLILNTYDNIEIINWIKHLDRNEGFKNLEFNNKIFDKNEEFRKNQYLYNQKPMCLLDCSKRIKNNLFYLDGDAFLINNIDTILEDDFDIGITIRPRDKIVDNARKMHFRAEINAGVIFFKTNSRKIEKFLTKWINEIESSNYLWTEQTALINTIDRGDQKIFKNNFYKKYIKISNLVFKIKSFPCSIYNHYNFKEGFNKKSTKILHLKQSERSLVEEEPEKVVFLIKLSIFYFKFLKIFPLKIRKYIKEIFNIYFLVNFLYNPVKIKNWLREMIKPINKKIAEEIIT